MQTDRYPDIIPTKFQRHTLIPCDKKKLSKVASYSEKKIHPSAVVYEQALPRKARAIALWVRGFPWPYCLRFASETLGVSSMVLKGKLEQNTTMTNSVSLSWTLFTMNGIDSSIIRGVQEAQCEANQSEIFRALPSSKNSFKSDKWHDCHLVKKIQPGHLSYT